LRTGFDRDQNGAPAEITASPIVRAAYLDDSKLEAAIATSPQFEEQA
jgi:hypothetical protein